MWLTSELGVGETYMDDDRDDDGGIGESDTVDGDEVSA